LKRVGVFIDLQNVYLATKTVFRDGRINFEALRKCFCREDSVVTFVVFTCYDPDHKPQIDFINHVALMGYRVVAKPFKRLPDGTIKASVDLEMAMEVLRQGPHLDEIVLVTGS